MTHKLLTKSIENRVEKDFGKIVRKEFTSWEQYYKFLSEGKILLISSKEDTFKSVAIVPNPDPLNDVNFITQRVFDSKKIKGVTFRKLPELKDLNKMFEK